MAYIGVQPTDTYLSIASQQITGTGSATYTLDYSVSNEEDVAVFVNNVRQNVSTYTVSGTSLTLGGTISASDSCWVLFLGRTVGTKTPAVGSVTNDMLAGSIANAKLANSSITLNGSAVSLGGSATIEGGVSNVNTVVITSSSTYTPTSGTKFIKVYAVGGGGGGGGSTSNNNDNFVGGGGSGGNTGIRTYNATELGANASISIGSGGSGGGTTGGGTGGDTDFNPAGTGVTLSGTGGRGGEGTSIQGRAGFNVSRQTSTGNSQYMHYGYFGKNAFRRNQASNEVEYSGAGGDSLFGRGGEPRTCNRNAAASVNGNSGFLGGGGSGSLINLSSGQSKTGGSGGDGMVVIEEYA